MFRPWVSKLQNSLTNVDHLQNETYEDNLDDFTLYLSDVSYNLIINHNFGQKPTLLVLE